MGKLYGYARVSTVQQDLDIQIEALKQYGVAEEDISTDKRTGANMERDQLKKLLDVVQIGDTIIVKKLDRLGRSVSQVTTLVEALANTGIFIKSIDDGVDTSNDSVMSKAMLHLLAMFSEMERNFIMERTQPAIKRAKENGVKFGRPVVNKALYEKAVKEFVEADGNKTVKQLIKEYGKDADGNDLIKEATFFRRLRTYKKRLEEQQGANQ